MPRAYQIKYQEASIWYSLESVSAQAGGGPDNYVEIERGPYLFPIDIRVDSYLKGSAKFGSSRSNGKCKHGGCDIYAPVGTKVYAVKDGTVIQNPYEFYRGSYAIEINHGDFTVRYSEISVVSGLQAGSVVVQGQLIGYVSDLGLNNSMIHFEMFSGDTTGSLTNRSNPPYMRRSDLMNPTQFLIFGY